MRSMEEIIRYEARKLVKSEAEILEILKSNFEVFFQVEKEHVYDLKIIISKLST